MWHGQGRAGSAWGHGKVLSAAGCPLRSETCRVNGECVVQQFWGNDYRKVLVHLLGMKLTNRAVPHRQA
ncbi:MAG: hypothetical protein II050_09330 [Bacteroidaceae bacterium]|nr:hypothetical protein [Bacteroidaceae bacterium]